MKWLIRMLAKGNKKTRGFTLVELMIVMIIVGILAAAAVPIYRFAVTRAYRSEAKASLGAIRAAELVYHAEYNTFLVVGAGDIGNEPTHATNPGLAIDVTHNTWFDTSTCFYVNATTDTFIAVALGSASSTTENNPVELIIVTLTNDGVWGYTAPATG